MKEPSGHDTYPSGSNALGGETVVISNVYSDGNKGGAAITELTGAFARRLVPGARLVLITVPSSGTKESSNERHSDNSQNSAVRIPPLLSTPGGFRTALGLLKGAITLLFPRILGGSHPGLSEVARARIVISKGGYLFGHRSGVRSILGLVSTSFPLLYAWRLAVPTVAYSTSVGPFSGRIHRLVTGLILRRLTAVLVRDSESEQRAIELGVTRSRLILMPDCVFGWRPQIDGFGAVGAHSSSLSIVLRDVQGVRDFLPTLQRVLVRSSEEGVFSRFQVVVQSDDDRLVTQSFVQRLQDLRLDAQMVDTALASPMQLLAIYGASAATISARLHGAIFSVLAGTPAIALSVDPGKAEGVLAEVGLRDWVLPPDPSRADDLFNLLVDARREPMAAQIRLLIEDAANRVGSCELQVQSLLDRSVPTPGRNVGSH